LACVSSSVANKSIAGTTTNMDSNGFRTMGAGCCRDCALVIEETARGINWIVSPKRLAIVGAIGLISLLAIFYFRTITTVAHSARAQASVRKQVEKLAGLLPHTRLELVLFMMLSLTAGFCEEFIFRGYLIWAFEPWLGWWGAATLSIPFFAALHAYQERKGVIQTGVIGVFLTLVVDTFGSLLPAMLLHALVDIGSGYSAWLALRDEP
jgi:membrane protease YdiL (CAAX protease family)